MNEKIASSSFSVLVWTWELANQLPEPYIFVKEYH